MDTRFIDSHYERPDQRPEPSGWVTDMMYALAIVVAFLVIFGIPAAHDSWRGSPDLPVPECGGCYAVSR